MTSDNSEILIIHHFRRLIPIPEVLFLRSKKASSKKQADMRNMFKKAFKKICRSTTVVSPDPSSPTLSTSTFPENTEYNPEPANE